MFFSVVHTIVAAASALRVSRHMEVVIGSAKYDVIDDFGAVGDGITDDTAAIQAALNACVATEGGVVVLRAGYEFLTFALVINSSKTELRIEGTLLVSNDRDAWPDGADVISGRDVSNVAITGGGIVDGQGEVWWEHRDDFRPKMVSWKGDHGLIHDVIFKNPPEHCLELSVSWLELSKTTILAPPSADAPVESHNTDAVDVHGAYVYVHDVYFDTGDDDVAVHQNHTLVENSYFGHGHGASIGSLCGAYITNMTVRNVTFNETASGARIKTVPKCAGRVWAVRFENLTMLDVPSPIVVDMFYGDGDKKGPLDATTMRIENVTYARIRATNAEEDAQVRCDPDSPCRDLVFDHLDFHHQDADTWLCEATNVESYVVSDVEPPGLDACLNSSSSGDVAAEKLATRAALG